jgi:chemotaxis signal transduction protein
VLKIPESEIETAPAMMQEGGLDCVTGLGKYQGRLIILLDVNKVLTAREPGDEPAATEAVTAATGKAGAQSASAGK